MPTQTKTPRGKSRPWVALFTSLLNDTDLILAGQDARGLFPYLLLHSAEQGLNGHVPADPRAVQLFAHLDGGVEAVQDALDELVAIGKLQRDGDGLYIRTWRNYQADFGGSNTRSDSNRSSAFRRYHEEGKHLEVVEGCELCAATMGRPVEVNDVGATPKATEVEQKVWERCLEVLAVADESGEDPFDAYVGLYEFVSDQAPRFADIEGVNEARLLNVVVDHAAQRYLSSDNKKPLSNGTLSKLHVLRGKHGIDVLEKLARATDAEKPAAYFFACFNNKADAAR
jgi:hypothetical protein